MNASEIDFLSLREMLGFTLPVMHTKGNNWYVDFYAHDPVSGVMKRKKYMLNKCKTDQKKRMMGSLLIHNITAKLTPPHFYILSAAARMRFETSQSALRSMFFFSSVKPPTPPLPSMPSSL